MLVDAMHFKRFPFEILLQGTDHFGQILVDSSKRRQDEGISVHGHFDEQTAMADAPITVILVPPNKDGTETAFRGMVILFGKIIIEYRLVVNTDVLEF